MQLKGFDLRQGNRQRADLVACLTVACLIKAFQTLYYIFVRLTAGYVSLSQ